MEKSKKNLKNNPHHNYIISKEFWRWLRKKEPWYLSVYYWPYRLWHNNIKSFPSEVKWFWQRGRRGYADCDVWDLHYYISTWLPKALRKLAKDCYGCPEKLLDRSKRNQCWQWPRILKEMAKGFELSQDDKIWTDKEKMKKFKESMDLFKKYFFSLWD